MLKIIRVSILSIFCVMSMIFLTGCRTYFGYDDITEEVREPVPNFLEIKNQSYFMTFSKKDDDLILNAFMTYEEVSKELSKKMVTGRINYYADFRSDFEDDYWKKTAINPWRKYESLTTKVIDDYDSLFAEEVEKPIKYTDLELEVNPITLPFHITNRLAQLSIHVMRRCIALSIDFTVWLGAPMIDIMAFPACYSYTAMAIPSVWFWKRSFLWYKDWNLRSHSPDIFTMMSYMPFINLFFFWQTPPYLVRDYRIESERDPYPESDWRTISQKEIITTTEKQKRCDDYRVEIELSNKNGEKSTRELRTNENGSIELTAFLKEHIKNTKENDTFYLKASLYVDGKKVCEREKEFAVKDFIPAEEKEDLKLYDNADYLNRILLKQRSGKTWKEYNISVVHDFEEVYGRINEHFEAKKDKGE